jgi:hypothetical protein
MLHRNNEERQKCAMSDEETEKKERKEKRNSAEIGLRHSSVRT